MTSNPRTAANPGQMGAQTTTGRCIVQRASTRNLQGPQAAVAYIEAHLGEPLTLDVIAQASHYSKYHLHRCFVESLGITASAYIWRRRLTEAARQLALTDRRIVDIAIEFGFGSQQAFTRAFKIGYKQPPCRFRRGSALYPLQLPALLADEFASQPPADRTTRLRFASPDDVPSWMELVGQAAAAVTTLMFNTVMVQLIGENGVAAVTVIIYAQFMVSTIFIGFSMGCAPVIAFNFGACNRTTLRRVFRSCLLCVGAASVAASLLSLAGAPAVACLFAPEGHEVNQLASDGLRLFSASFLFAGTNLFASAAFTALSNGALSALISFLRTFGLVPAALLVLPGMLGVTGVWVAVPIAEAITFVVSAELLWGMRKRYGYS